MGMKARKHKIWDIITPLSSIKEDRGKSDQLFTLPAYAFLLLDNTFKNSKSNNKGHNTDNTKFLQFSDPSLTPAQDCDSISKITPSYSK